MDNEYAYKIWDTQIKSFVSGARGKRIYPTSGKAAIGFYHGYGHRISDQERFEIKQFQLVLRESWLNEQVEFDKKWRRVIKKHPRINELINDIEEIMKGDE